MNLVIALTLIPFISLIYPYSSIKELKEQPKDTIREFINDILKLKNYELINDKIDIQFKSLSINIIVNTNQGKKFLKLHDQGNGRREYIGAKLIGKSLSVVEPEDLIISDNFELIIQPFIEQINQSILFNIIENLKDNQYSVKFITIMFSQMFNIIVSNLEYTVKPTLNDNLYINRLKTKAMDNESGRIEIFYKDNQLNLAGLEISWESLLKKQISIDNVLYKETLDDLLKEAKNSLNDNNQRLISICHGDWHDMNTYITNLDYKNPTFCFIDCEYSGLNDIIGDAVVYLIYNSVLMAYLSPKYYSEQFKNIPGFYNAQRNFTYAKRNIKPSIDDQIINLNGIKNFGTSNIRKEITNLFINNYFNPLIQEATQRFKLDFNEIEKKIKGCILLRFLGIYNISLMEPMDQAKILGLIFKTLATPVKPLNHTPILKRFEEAL